jgi:hypothetical protein
MGGFPPDAMLAIMRSRLLPHALWSTSMVTGRVLLLCALLGCAGLASPARAGDWAAPDQWSYWDIRDAIYARVNLIAHLEANPEIDDAVRGPLITTARVEIHRLRAMLGPPPAESFAPCCYARKPLYVR